MKARRHKLANLDTLKSAMRLAGNAFGQLARIYGSRITPLAAAAGKTPGTGLVDAFPDVVTATLNRVDHQKLRETATKRGVMLNDFLLADVILAIRDWNRMQGVKSRQRIRIMMPSDLRDTEDFAMPAANMTSYNFITRVGPDCDDAENLLRGIRDETMRIKHDHLGRQFVEGLIATSYIPGLLRYLARRRRCLATAVFSNMGDPTRRFLATFPRQGGKLVCGNLVLEKMLGVSPIRPFTRIAVSIVTLYRELIINVRCDPLHISPDQARTFLDFYTQRLRSHIQ
jgi:hypothetical protein